MRIGGLNKLAEITVMVTACGLEIGIETLGEYYQSQELAEIAGSLTAISVFIYITLMEVVSILENYAQIEPNAEWAKKFVKKLRNHDDNDDKKE